MFLQAFRRKITYKTSVIIPTKSAKNLRKSKCQRATVHEEGLIVLHYLHWLLKLFSEAGSSWRTIKMSMPDNSDLRQIIMAFCMVRIFLNQICFHRENFHTSVKKFLSGKILFLKVSFLFSSMSLVWSFSTVVPWLIGRGYVKANCSLVGVSGLKSQLRI